MCIRDSICSWGLGDMLRIFFGGFLRMCWGCNLDMSGATMGGVWTVLGRVSGGQAQLKEKCKQSTKQIRLWGGV